MSLRSFLFLSAGDCHRRDGNKHLPCQPNLFPPFDAWMCSRKAAWPLGKKLQDPCDSKAFVKPRSSNLGPETFSKFLPAVPAHPRDDPACGKTLFHGRKTLFHHPFPPSSPPRQQQEHPPPRLEGPARGHPHPLRRLQLGVLQLQIPVLQLQIVVLQLRIGRLQLWIGGSGLRRGVLRLQHGGPRFWLTIRRLPIVVLRLDRKSTRLNSSH